MPCIYYICIMEKSIKKQYDKAPKFEQEYFDFLTSGIYATDVAAELSFRPIESIEQYRAAIIDELERRKDAKLRPFWKENIEQEINAVEKYDLKYILRLMHHTPDPIVCVEHLLM